MNRGCLSFAVVALSAFACRAEVGVSGGHEHSCAPDAPRVQLRGYRSMARDTADGFAGLPAVLVHLGVKNVVATTRVQEDGEISDFVHAFFRSGALREPASAFRRAAAASEDDHAEVVRLWGR